MFKVNNTNTRTTPMALLCFFIVNFEHISRFFLVLLLLILSKQTLAGNSYVIQIQLHEVNHESLLVILSHALILNDTGYEKLWRYNIPLLKVDDSTYFQNSKAAICRYLESITPQTSSCEFYEIFKKPLLCRILRGD